MMGSQNKATNSLQDVSGATITQMLTKNWELISEKMWRSVAAQIGVKYTKWNIVETRIVLSFMEESVALRESRIVKDAA